MYDFRKIHLRLFKGLECNEIKRIHQDLILYLIPHGYPGRRMAAYETEITEIIT